MSAESVAIFAPGGYDPDPARLGRAERYLASRGCSVTTAFSGDRHGRFSGTDAERLRWIARVVGDPTIDIALALRGGYGASRLLKAIDFPAMAVASRRGTRFVGHSDFTALSLGLLATTGAISFAGPMAGYDFGEADVDSFTETHFWRAMREHRVEVDFATAHSSNRLLGGVLWGGNLAMLANLVGTPWMPTIDRGILFIEDINEQPYRIERMMLQLHHAGILERQAAVLWGDFSGIRATDYDNGYGLADAFDHIASRTSTPLINGLPFGHCRQKLTLAVGARAEVRIADGRCRLTQSWKPAST